MSGTVKQVSIIDDETGELLREVFSKGSQNGKGFVLMYTDKVVDLILKCPSAATLKVFLLLSMGQQFEERGVITTKKAVADKLGITKPTCLDAFKWLKDNFVINEFRVDGHTEFMVNPAFVTVGKDKKKRLKEWQRRWAGQTVKTIEAPKPKRSIEM